MGGFVTLPPYYDSSIPDLNNSEGKRYLFGGGEERDGVLR